VAPEITEALQLIRTADPMLARMSGSGATCFGVYRSPAGLERAREIVQAARPDWWVAGSVTI
jgi:4-diphosphocytidyl-2-C-methyl-D-erythritol kinase